MVGFQNILLGGLHSVANLKMVFSGDSSDTSVTDCTCDECENDFDDMEEADEADNVNSLGKIFPSNCSNMLKSLRINR